MTTVRKFEIKKDSRAEGDFSVYVSDNGFQWWYTGFTFRTAQAAQAAIKIMETWS